MDPLPEICVWGGETPKEKMQLLTLLLPKWFSEGLGEGIERLCIGGGIYFGPLPKKGEAKKCDGRVAIGDG